MQAEFGARRIYYNNCAAHLLNAYNPNMLYPHLPYRWDDREWHRLIDMIAGFGFNAFEFWLVPRLFCREGIESKYGQEFIRQMNCVIDHAHSHREKHETFFVVKGKVRMTLNGEERIMEEGDVLPVAVGELHSFTGVGAALLLELSKPCEIDDNYFEDRRIPIGGNYENNV